MEGIRKSILLPVGFKPGGKNIPGFFMIGFNRLPEVLDPEKRSVSLLFCFGRFGILSRVLGCFLNIRGFERRSFRNGRWERSISLLLRKGLSCFFRFRHGRSAGGLMILFKENLPFLLSLVLHLQNLRREVEPTSGSSERLP